MFLVSRDVVDECFHVHSFSRKTLLKLLREFLICSRSSHTEKIMIDWYARLAVIWFSGKSERWPNRFKPLAVIAQSTFHLRFWGYLLEHFLLNSASFQEHSAASTLQTCIYFVVISRGPSNRLK